MDYSLPCKCGRSVTVTEGAAGSNVPCECGQGVPVPTRAQLRSQAGMLTHVAPQVINEMIAAGDLPTLQTCAGCGIRTARSADVGATWVEGDGPAPGVWISLNPLFLLLNLFELLFAFLARKTWKYQMRLRIRLCPACGVIRRRETEIEALVRKEPIYGQLLDSLPGAKLRML